jgi:general secretion pathway protein D
VAVQDGETVALGGLITDSRTSDKTGIPWLQEIPVVGSLFGDNGAVNTKTELIVLITPHVINNAMQARAVTEELRQKLGEDCLRP